MTSDIERLRDDLAAVRAATGLDPAWTPSAIRTHLLLAAAGLVAAIWAVVPHGFWPVAGLAAFVVPVADWWWHARGRGDRTAADDREWQESMAVFWYVLPLAALAMWSRAVGLNLVTLTGLILFMLGFVLFGSAVSERRQRPLLGWAVAFMSGGLVAPLGIVPLVPVVALAITLGAVVSAAWIAVDLRRNRAAA